MDKKGEGSKFFLIGGVVVLLLIIIGAVFLLNSDDKEKEKPTSTEVLEGEEEIVDITSGGCEKLALSFNTQQAYSCFDNENNLVKLYVSRSSENVILKKIDFVISSTNSSVNSSSSYGLAPGSFYVYPITYTLENVQKIEIIPVVQDDGGEKICESLFVNFLSNCTVEEVISAEPEPDYYYDENLNVIFANDTSDVSNVTNETNGSGIVSTSIFLNKPQKKILAFSLDSVSGEIDEVRHRIFVKFGDNRSLKYLVPVISISENATISPLSGVGRDFTAPVNYLVRASDNSTQQYTVYVSNLIEEVVEVPLPPVQNQTEVNLTDIWDEVEDINYEACPECRLNLSEGLNFSDTDFENETPVPPAPRIVTNLSGTVAGTWSTNLSAASQIAQMNKKFYIINYGNLGSCGPCNSAEKYIFNTPEFKQWAYDNGIAMIYASDKYSNLEPTKTITQRYIRPLQASGVDIKFPFMIIVGYESNQAVASFVLRSGMNINGIKANLTPANFIRIVDSYTGKYKTNLTAVPTPASTLTVTPISVTGSHVLNTYQDSYGALKESIQPMYYDGGSIKLLTTGAQVGEWTYDWEAAKALSKINGRPLILWFAGPSCASCESAKSTIFSKPEFKQWAKDNKFAMVYINGGCLDSKQPDYTYCNPTIKEFMRLYPGFTAYTLLLLKDGDDYSKDFAMYYTVREWTLKTGGSGYINFLMGPSGFKESVDFFINARDDSLNTSKFLVSPVLLNINSQKKNYNLYNEYSINSLMWLWDTRHRSQDVVDWYNLTGIVSGGKYFIRAINVSDVRRMNTNSSSPMIKTSSDVRNIGKVSLYSGLDNANKGISFKEMSLTDLSNGYQFIAANNQNIYLKIWRSFVNLSGYDNYKTYRDANNISNTSSFYDSIEYNLEYYQV